MPSVKVDLPAEISEKVEHETLASGSSRQKIIQNIIEEHYSSAVKRSNSDPNSELQHKTELLEAAMRENEVLREYLDMLQNISVMFATKQLLLAGQAKESWWTRLKNKIKRKKE